MNVNFSAMEVPIMRKETFSTDWCLLRRLIVMVLTVVLLVPTLAGARVTRIEITDRQVVNDGMPFGSAGTYEKLIGRAYAEVDPDHPGNAIITDIELVPPNDRGMVEVGFDIMILKPVDMSLGNGKILLSVTNRGIKGIFPLLNDTQVFPVDNPSAPADFGNGFLMRQGYTMVWNGWEGDVMHGIGLMTIDLPVPTADGAPDGEAVTGKVMVSYSDRYFAGGNPTTLPLSGGVGWGVFESYEAVSTDQTVAEAELRVSPSDSFRPGRAGIPEGTLIPASEWSFAHCPEGPPGTPSTFNICYPAGFQNDQVYNLVYRAKNPKVMGLGYAATRDLISFLRYEDEDDEGHPNPLEYEIDKVLCWGGSLSGAFLRDFLFQGFNLDEEERMVCDGIDVHIAGAMKPFLNYRFGQPTAAPLHHAERYAPAAEFPATYEVIPDPLGEVADNGILKRCRETESCPKVIQVDTSTEYQVLRAAQAHTDGHGNDVPVPPEVRMYLLAGSQHYAIKGVPSNTAGGMLKYPSNTTHNGAVARALLVALDEWVTNGTPPPESRIPTVTDGTLVPPDRDSVGFPQIPGINFTGEINFSGERDFGPGVPRGENRGVIDTLPPEVLSEHVNLVPKVDQFGIDLGGINQPIVAVPRATLTGWNLRTAPFTEDDLSGLDGIEIPLFRTEAERLAAGDERPSIEELYTSNDDYVSKITAAANQLRQQRLLLDEDVSRIIAEAEKVQLFCEPDETTLCLGNRRFQVTVNWRDFRGRTGDGRVVPGANETSGTFWFFSPDNWELLVKVLDGCSYNGHLWLFAAGATNVELTLTVTDIHTGAVRAYSNPLGAAASAITDTSAFTVCGPGWDLNQNKALDQDLSGYMESKR
jgi:hypothetical protein